MDQNTTDMVRCPDCAWTGTQAADAGYEEQVRTVQAHDVAVVRVGLDPEGCGPLVLG